METFETLRRRRMCRSFFDKAVSEELIERLLYAANRAPAAGNVRTSNIILIRDVYTIQEIKRVSPGFGGMCPVLFAICTDETASQESDVASFDAGTIAENMALAAVDLGLGVCFLKSFPDEAVRKILKITEQRDVKIEMLVCVGYPAKDQTKTRSVQIKLFKESYGNEGSAPTRNVVKVNANLDDRENTKRERSSDDSPLFDLALFILASARTTIDESNRYGPKRLVDTLTRLLEIPSSSFDGDKRKDDFLSSVRSELLKRQDLRSSSMVYTKEYKDFLDDLLKRFVSEMEKQRPA